MRRRGNMYLPGITAAAAIIAAFFCGAADKAGGDQCIAFAHTCQTRLHIDGGGSIGHLRTNAAAQRVRGRVGIAIRIAVTGPYIGLYVYCAAGTMPVCIVGAGQGVTSDTVYQKNDRSFFSKFAHILSLRLVTLSQRFGEQGATLMALS